MGVFHHRKRDTVTIDIVDDENKIIEKFDSVENMFNEINKRWVKEHPFLNWYDNTCYKIFGKSRWFYFGYNPHVSIINPYIVFKQACREMKWAYQRVVYGVDERASWGVGFWLSDIMPKVLKKISGSEYGTPFAFYDNPDDTSYEAEKKANKKYDQVLIDLMWAFNEMKQLEDFETSKYPDIETAMVEFRARESKAKEKLKLLIDYYWEIGD